mgnify:CR=1 FL=1
MVVNHKENVEFKKMDSPLVRGAFMKAVISPKEGWEGYVMRIVKLDKDGYSPKHTHDWPHINYIIKGKGQLLIDGKDYELKEGSYAYVPGGAMHQFKNIGGEDLEFICIVPEEGHN